MSTSGQIARLRVLLWYVHGSYVNALVRGPHRYLIPDSGPTETQAPVPTSPWPSGVELLSAGELAGDPPDLVIVQRTAEVDFCRQRLGFTPGLEVPAIFLEHNTPRDDIPTTVHAMADRPDWLIVQVSAFNALMWDCGSTPTLTIGHGLPAPDLEWQPRLDRAAVVINEPVRRGRVTGTDLIAPVAGGMGVDAFGIDADLLPSRYPDADIRFGGNLALDELHREVAGRRLYLHLNRWTSLGLSLIEAMQLGMPCVVLATTEAATLPDAIGAVSTDLGYLRERVARLRTDDEEAARCGAAARAVATERFGLPTFLDRWDAALDRCVAARLG